MIKICLAIFILLLSVIGGQLSRVAGQNVSPSNPLERAKEDYNFQYLKFREAEEKYKTAKNSYVSFKTAVSKDEAYSATKDYLTQVDNLYISLALLVQEYINSLNWRTHSTQKEQLGKSLAEEVNFLKDHQNKVKNAQTLEELPPLAKELETRIKKTLEPKLNYATASLEVIQGEDALVDFNEIAQILDKIVMAKINAGRTDSLLANWSSEIADIRNKTEQNLREARKDLEKPKSDMISSGALENVVQFSKRAKTELRRSKPLFEEILRIL